MSQRTKPAKHVRRYYVVVAKPGRRLTGEGPYTHREARRKAREHAETAYVEIAVGSMDGRRFTPKF